MCYKLRYEIHLRVWFDYIRRDALGQDEKKTKSETWKAVSGRHRDQNYRCPLRFVFPECELGLLRTFQFQVLRIIVS